MNKISDVYRKIKFCKGFGAAWVDRWRLVRLTLEYMIAVRYKPLYHRMQSDQTVHQIDAVFKGKKIPLHFRLQDISMLYEVWMDESYALKKTIGKTGAILDLGAHVGFTTLYYWTILGDNYEYVCVEGSTKNAEVLSDNTNPIKNCKVLQHIITSDGRRVKYYDEVSGHLHQVHLTKGVEQESVTLQSILDIENINTIALCKMDIEGMEHEILTQNIEWLEGVLQIYLELHQSNKNEALKDKMITLGFEWNEVNGIIRMSK